MSTPRSRWIEGSATFTTVLSSMIMNSPNETAARVNHLRLSGSWIRARTRAVLAADYCSAVPDVVWEPSADVLERANVVRFMRRHGYEDFAAFQQRSQDDPEWFWPAVVEDLGLEFSQPWERVLDLSRGLEWATWFVGGRLNIADACVHRWAREAPDRPAAVWLGEDGARVELTYDELSHEVTRLAEALVALGVEPG